MTLRIALASLLLAISLFPAGLSAQGTKADYARSAALPRQWENKVHRASVQPHWFESSKRLWYRVQTGVNKYEFVLVDVEKGERRLAFDHAELAATFGKLLKRELRPDQLPLEELEFDKSGTLIHVRAGGRRCKLDVDKKEWFEDATAGAEGEGGPLPKSKNGGGDIELTVVNRTRGEVRLLWIDPEGKQVDYGAIAAGEEKEQHTFEGHAWLITDTAGKRLKVFTADAASDTVSIDPPRGEAAVRDAPRRRIRAGRADGRSPDGKWTAVVRDFNIVLRDADGTERKLTSDGDKDDYYVGPVAWSPDSKQFVATKTKGAPPRQITLVESRPKDQVQPKLHALDYRKPGDALPHPRPQLFEVSEGKQIPISDALFPNPYTERDRLDIRWSPDASRFTFVYNQRGHQVLRVISVDAASGEAKAIVDEQSKTFVDYAHKQYSHWLDETSELIWMSERDGWNHLWLFDSRTGDGKNQMTSGEWVVRRVERVDEEARQVWFLAGGVRAGQDPYYLHLCRVSFDGSGFIVLTEGDGNHAVSFSPNREFFIDTWSRVDLPPVIELRRSSDGKLVCELERADWSALCESGWSPAERFVAKGRDGATDIYGIIIKPTNFDPAKKYPIVEEVYAGPQGFYVPKSFDRLVRQHQLAELGFIVVKVDGMGTSGRSKAFHDTCFKNLGDAGFPDRIAWIKAAAKTRPWMDESRVGIYGGSAGGQNAARALIAHHDFYHVAVADCGCHDNRMDKIWWNELWMSWPLGPHYDESSNVTQAHRLAGKLLLIVGELDNNVDPASTMQVADALQKAGKDYDLLVVTGARHGAAETPYGNRRRQDFLVRHLWNAEPRQP